MCVLVCRFPALSAPWFGPLCFSLVFGVLPLLPKQRSDYFRLWSENDFSLMTWHTIVGKRWSVGHSRIWATSYEDYEPVRTKFLCSPFNESLVHFVCGVKLVLTAQQNRTTCNRRSGVPRYLIRIPKSFCVLCAPAGWVSVSRWSSHVYPGCLLPVQRAAPRGKLRSTEWTCKQCHFEFNLLSESMKWSFAWISDWEMLRWMQWILNLWTRRLFAVFFHTQASFLTGGDSPDFWNCLRWCDLFADVLPLLLLQRLLWNPQQSQHWWFCTSVEWFQYFLPFCDVVFPCTTSRSWTKWAILNSKQLSLWTNDDCWVFVDGGCGGGANSGGVPGVPGPQRARTAAHRPGKFRTLAVGDTMNHTRALSSRASVSHRARCCDARFCCREIVARWKMWERIQQKAPFGTFCIRLLRVHTLRNFQVWDMVCPNKLKLLCRHLRNLLHIDVVRCVFAGGMLCSWMLLSDTVMSHFDLELRFFLVCSLRKNCRVDNCLVHGYMKPFFDWEDKSTFVSHREWDRLSRCCSLDRSSLIFRNGSSRCCEHQKHIDVLFWHHSEYVRVLHTHVLMFTFFHSCVGIYVLRIVQFVHIVLCTLRRHFMRTNTEHLTAWALVTGC